VNNGIQNQDEGYFILEIEFRKVVLSRGQWLMACKAQKLPTHQPKTDTNRYNKIICAVNVAGQRSFSKLS
jgi:hypothetical protein